LPNPEAEITAEDYRKVLEFILKLWYLWGGVKGRPKDAYMFVKVSLPLDLVGILWHGPAAVTGSLDFPPNVRDPPDEIPSSIIRSKPGTRPES